jgi:hypothetical protein
MPLDLVAGPVRDLCSAPPVRRDAQDPLALGARGGRGPVVISDPSRERS